MLVITRKVGESFFIGNKEVTIKILGKTCNEIKVGIDASEDIPILREEIYDKFKDSFYKKRYIK
jgi:carbon storage regulator CsrA